MEGRGVVLDLFICVFMGVGPFVWFLGCYICAALLFGARTNVFLTGKAETAVKTRQVFHHTPRAVVKDPSTVFRVCGVEQAVER